MKSSFGIGVMTLFSVLLGTNLAGNVTVCLIITIYQDMRTPGNILLLNLAVADMMVALFITPRFIWSHFFIHPDGIAGTLLCKLLTSGNLTWVGGAASIFTMVAIAFERYCAVIYPHSKRGKLTYNKVKVIIPASWLSAAVLNAPVFFTIYYDKEIDFCMEYWPSEWLPRAYSLTWFCVAGIIPVMLMTTLYSRVVYSLWFTQTGKNDTRQGVKKIRKRVTKIILTATVIYGFCWMTNLTFYVRRYYHLSHVVAYIGSTVLVTCNSTVNPFIYVFVNQRFRSKIKSLLFCGQTCSNRVESSSARVSTQ